MPPIAKNSTNFDVPRRAVIKIPLQDRVDFEHESLVGSDLKLVGFVVRFKRSANKPPGELNSFPEETNMKFSLEEDTLLLEFDSTAVGTLLPSGALRLSTTRGERPILGEELWASLTIYRPCDHPPDAAESVPHAGGDAKEEEESFPLTRSGTSSTTIELDVPTPRSPFLAKGRFCGDGIAWRGSISVNCDTSLPPNFEGTVGTNTRVTRRDNKLLLTFDLGRIAHGGVAKTNGSNTIGFEYVHGEFGELFEGLKVTLRLWEQGSRSKRLRADSPAAKPEPRSNRCPPQDRRSTESTVPPQVMEATVVQAPSSPTSPNTVELTSNALALEQR